MNNTNNVGCGSLFRKVCLSPFDHPDVVEEIASESVAKEGVRKATQGGRLRGFVLAKQVQRQVVRVGVLTERTRVAG